ncbi:uncharacterized protein Z519_11504 [Cladophialophora bantiana CBS 173.52]|uniref:Uncharacterized protein n=1 Tax=Cladophialophora bantiana (strain ATCC 10958 / CBS 173.52 / CDC B-1940 / NIH 8579) TaxID=1442370 RepID=A0A0D2HTX6_CLAB1|nr:uncharacterized protein Z519_11504 [Cladophialophora bantiana CBS 173.52]KIW87919.1 hypothetical protein Z519_11504 [Cladophialophora bantiana CBS 173.52]
MDSKLHGPESEGQYESDGSEGHGVPPPAYRRNSESSTERSLYDAKDEALFAGSQASPNSAREYGWYHPKLLSRGLVITDAAASTATGKAPLYYVEVSEFALKKPDVVLHALPPTTGMTNDLEYLANTGESGPVVGVAHFPKFSRHIKVGLGDPSSTDATMTYVEVRNPNLMTHGEYHMSLNGKSYAWKRTHDAAAGVEGGSATRILHRESFQLIDMGANEVIAVFLDNKFKSWKKKGKLRIFRDLEDGSGGELGTQRQLKLLVFLSIAAILEKARRRANRRRSNSGGGGGP